ncbi:MAG TPA: DUF502 domain-containing protein [Rhizomicrobium sp.]|nr:DUF502 domain-containing protein [Rhizomicrobium sp.]
MPQTGTRKRSLAGSFQSNLLAGLLTIAPLAVVWFVFDFFLTALSQAGYPLGLTLIDFLDQNYPALTPWLANENVRWMIGVVVALLALYTIGAIASRVIGQQLIRLFELLIARIPLVQSIYSATKKLVSVVQQKPDGHARVVLIEFPHPGLRAIGLVMRTFTDATTGQELAAVFVPTSPNPTSGYLEIAPLDRLVATDMTMDQAMSMIVSGGATAPDRITIAPVVAG